MSALRNLVLETEHLRTLEYAGRKIQLVFLLEKPGLPWYRVSGIGATSKENAAKVVGDRVMKGTVFPPKVMKQAEEIHITHMQHTSDGDGEEHWSVEAWRNGQRLSHGHVPVNEKLQKVAAIDETWGK